MKFYDQGASVRVMIPRNEVYELGRKWPGSDLPDKNVSLIFDKKNLDIEEIYPRDLDDVDPLLEEAREFAEKEMKKRHACTERLDRIATELEQAGRPDMALTLDRVSDRLEGRNAGSIEIRDLTDFDELDGDSFKLHGITGYVPDKKIIFCLDDTRYEIQVKEYEAPVKTSKMALPQDAEEVTVKVEKYDDGSIIQFNNKKNVSVLTLGYEYHETWSDDQYVTFTIEAHAL